MKIIFIYFLTLSTNLFGQLQPLPTNNNYVRKGSLLTMPNSSLANGTNDVGGSDFTITSSGTWKITVTATITNSTANQNASILLYTDANVQVPNFKLSMFSTTGSYSAYEQMTTSTEVTIITATSFKLKSYYAVGSGLFINNSNSNTDGASSSIFWEKIAD